MGQYYKPISIDKKQWVYSHDYRNGLKLMEHSWIGNNFVAAVEGLIAEGGAWHGDRIVWAGDYADPEKGKNGKPTKRNLWDHCDKDNQKLTPEVPKTKFRYVINLDTKEFVDKNKVPLSDVYTDDKGKEWPYTIHPLPILTCEGNGRGGGDLHKESPLVGKWARNRVTVSTKKPAGFTEVIFDVFEGVIPAQLTKKPSKGKPKEDVNEMRPDMMI